VAETAGTLEALRVDVGDRVEEGQELAILASPDAEHQLREQQARVAVARSSLDGAKVEVGQARREMERRRGAVELFSTEQIEAAEFQLELAELEQQRRRAALDEAQAVLDRLRDLSHRRHLRAPFAGLISARRAVPGATLSPGDPVLRLVATAAPLVRFAVPAPTLGGLEPGTEVKVELASAEGSTAPEPVTALIETLAPVLDEASQLVFIEASAPAEAWSGYPVGAVTRVSTVRDLATYGSCRGRSVVVLPE
jgi:RND family efflux transporter MFP subunit